MKARRDLLQLQLQLQHNVVAAKTHAAGVGGEGRLRELLKENGPLGWVARQGLVGGGLGGHDGGGGGSGGSQGGDGGGTGGADGGGGVGLDVVYFNYPEHLAGLTLQQVGERGRVDVGLCCIP